MSQPAKRDGGHQRSLHAVRHAFPHHHSRRITCVSVGFHVVTDFAIQIALNSRGSRKCAKHLPFAAIKGRGDHFSYFAVTVSRAGGRFASGWTAIPPPHCYILTKAYAGSAIGRRD